MDEVIATVVSLIVALPFWLRIVGRAISVNPAIARGPMRWGLLLLPVLTVALLLPLLHLVASHDVRNDPRYLSMYTVMGFGWVSLWVATLRLSGLQIADVTERRNPGALLMYLGAVIGFACAFAGANVGDGPGWWVVTFAAVLSSLALWVVIISEHFIVRVDHRVLVDRDVGVALRLAAVMIAAGVVGGRAVAGTWVSFEATLTDFLEVSWTLLPLIVLDAMVTIVTRMGVSRTPLVLDGLLALLYLGAAIGFVIWLGMPP